MSIKKIEADLKKQKIFNNKLEKNILNKLKKEINQDFSFAQKSPFPKFKSLNQDIYSK